MSFGLDSILQLTIKYCTFIKASIRFICVTQSNKKKSWVIFVSNHNSAKSYQINETLELNLLLPSNTIDNDFVDLLSYIRN